jgi:hypothetical protein
MGGFQKNVSLWPGGVIPYIPNESHPFWKLIQKSINEINSKTRIKFVPIINTENIDFFIGFTSISKGNSSMVGQSQTPVNIDKNVRAMHELTHVIGLVHEHQRIDRDNFITLHLDVLSLDDWTKSQIIDKLETESQTEYDIGSCQHYWCTAGRRENTEAFTMTNNKHPTKKFDTSEHLSKLDIVCINTKYEVFENDLQQYPSWGIPQLYKIARNSNFFKRFSKQRSSRNNQIALLQTAIKQFENDKNIGKLTMTLNHLKDEISKESHLLGKSCLLGICVNLLQGLQKMK